MIKNAFIFDSLIQDSDFYKELAEKYSNYDEQLAAFNKIREEAVNYELSKNIKLYKKLIDNVLLTDVRPSIEEKIKVAEKYFIRDFYKTPVYYAFHLLHFNSSDFIKNNVEFVNKEVYLQAIKKYGTVILNPLHNDLYQMLPAYMSIVDKKAIYSLYGVETALKKIETINQIYTPNVKSMEYNYVADNNGLPFPLIFRKALKDIQSGKIVAILPEISMGLGPKYSTKLLGQKVSMPLGSSWISNKTQVPIVLVHTEMTYKYKIKITFEQPIYPLQENSKKNIITQANQVFELIDRIIREHPFSWCGYDSFDYQIITSK